VNGSGSTSNSANLAISFADNPLNVLDDNSFMDFFVSLFSEASVAVELKGTTDLVAKTSIGDVPISGIPFDASSTLTGINSFGNTMNLSNFSSISAAVGVDSLWTLDITLENASNISLATVGLSLPTFYEGVEVNTLRVIQVSLHKYYLDWPNGGG
jgi:hypothetical protein